MSVVEEELVVLSDEERGRGGNLGRRDVQRRWSLAEALQGCGDFEMMYWGGGIRKRLCHKEMHQDGPAMPSALYQHSPYQAMPVCTIWEQVGIFDLARSDI